MTTLADLINEVHRRIEPSEETPTVSLSSSVAANATSLPYSDTSEGSNNSGAILTGRIASVDLELYLITGAPANGSIPVQAGYRGSTSAAHASGTLVYLQPKFSDFDILRAINSDLLDLSSPTNGLYNISSLDISYNPVVSAYDLTDVNTGDPVADLIDIIAIRFKTPLPNRQFLAITDDEWEVIPAMTDDYFPSGYSLVLHEGGFPGFPVHIIYRQAFGQFSSYTDDATQVAHLSSTMVDLPGLGAFIRLAPPHEVERNSTGEQPDSRLAAEVPPGAMMHATDFEVQLRADRISAEAARLARTFSRLRTRYR